MQKQKLFYGLSYGQYQNSSCFWQNKKSTIFSCLFSASFNNFTKEILFPSASYRQKYFGVIRRTTSVFCLCRNRSYFMAYHMGNTRTAAVSGRMFPCWKRGNCKLFCLWKMQSFPFADKGNSQKFLFRISAEAAGSKPKYSKILPRGTEPIDWVFWVLCCP